MPDSNSALADAANLNYYGTTNIVLNGNTMTVTTRNAAGTADVGPTDVTIPDNAVIYVHNAANGCSRTDLPTNPGSYDTRDGCANVFISGNYSKDITIGSDKDIIVRGDVTRTRFAGVPADVEMGLIATSYVRVMHGTSGGANVAAYTMQDVTIEAAIMSVQHSFIVDNWNEGARLGTLTVFGAIAQKFRGPVGTSTPTGYTKSYKLRRPHALPQPAVLPGRVVGRMGDRPQQRAGPGRVPQRGRRDGLPASPGAARRAFVRSASAAPRDQLLIEGGSQLRPRVTPPSPSVPWLPSAGARARELIQEEAQRRIQLGPLPRRCLARAG